jgi:hypothetical protein
VLSPLGLCPLVLSPLALSPLVLSRFRPQRLLSGRPMTPPG